MTPSRSPLTVALEEHYWDRDLLALFPGREGKRVSEVETRLLDMGELRLREMDEAGFALSGRYDFTKADGQDYFLIFTQRR